MGVGACECDGVMKCTCVLLCLNVYVCQRFKASMHAHWLTKRDGSRRIDWDGTQLVVLYSETVYIVNTVQQSHFNHFISDCSGITNPVQEQDGTGRTTLAGAPTHSAIRSELTGGTGVVERPSIATDNDVNMLNPMEEGEGNGPGQMSLLPPPPEEREAGGPPDGRPS